MKINFRSVKQITTTLCMATLLVSCDGSNKEVPKPPTPVPVGKVSGVVMLGPVDNATLTLYKLDPVTGEEIEPAFNIMSNATGRSGKFNFTLQQDAAETPFALCATGGSYNEPAASTNSTSASKEFAQGERLCAAFVYKKADANSKTGTIINITFFTHLAYGITKYEMSLGGGKVLTDKIIPADTQAGTAESIEYGAIGKGNDDVRQWFNFNDPILGITPRLVNDSRNRESNGTPSEGLKYGLALTGISSTADWMVIEQSIAAKDANTVAEGSFENVSSISFAQSVHDDLVNDGEINGSGTNGDVQLNGTRLDAHIFLHHFPARMLAVSGTTINKSEVVRGFSPFIVQIAEFRDAIFDPLTSTEGLSNSLPNILHPAGFDTATLLKGTKTFKVNVLDLSGIKSALLTITKDGTTTPVGIFDKLAPNVEPSVDDPSLKVWEIDTTTLTDGLYTFTVDVVNNDGKSNFEKTPNIKIGNKGINVQITAPSKTALPVIFNGGSQTFTANVTDPFPGTIVAFEVVAAGVTDDKTAKLKTMPVPKLIPGPVGVAGAVYSTSYSFPGLVDNDYQFRAIAKSGSGTGVLAQQAFDLIAFSLDSKLPTGNITSPAPNAIVKTQQLTVNASVSDIAPTGGKASGVKSASVIVAGKSYPLNVNNGLASGSINLAGEGFHNINLEVVDNAQNTFKDLTPIRVGFDKSDPKVTISSSTKGVKGWVKSLDFTGVATDNPGTGIVRISYKLGASGTENLIINSTAIGSLDFSKNNVVATSNGKTDVIIVAVDDAGRPGQAIIPQVGFDILKPEMSATIVAPANITNAVVNSTTGGIWSPTVSPKFTVDLIATELGATAGSQSGLLSVNTGIKNETVLASQESVKFPISQTMNVSMGNATFTVNAKKFSTNKVYATCATGEKYSTTPVAPNSSSVINVFNAGANSPGTKICFKSVKTTITPTTVGIPKFMYTYTKGTIGYNWLPAVNSIKILSANLKKGTLDKAGSSSIKLNVSAIDNATNETNKVICLNATVKNKANTAAPNYKTNSEFKTGSAQFRYLDSVAGYTYPPVPNPQTVPVKSNCVGYPEPVFSGGRGLLIPCTRPGTSKNAINVLDTQGSQTFSGIRNNYSVVYSSTNGLAAIGTACPN